MTPSIYFVAFIDLLGFSNMVKSDLESASGSERYIHKLHQIHQQTLALMTSTFELDLVQFSDSIVIATEFKKENFGSFIGLIAKYQFDLLSEGIICRGGVAYGKHFYQDGFMFSLGLINAYHLETQVAKYPRVVVSEDLIDLMYDTRHIPDGIPLIHEYDGAYFVDYLVYGSEPLTTINGQIQHHITSSNPSIREKYLWLAEYINYKFGATVPHEPRFS